MSDLAILKTASWVQLESDPFHLQARFRSTDPYDQAMVALNESRRITTALNDDNRIEVDNSQFTLDFIGEDLCRRVRFAADLQKTFEQAGITIPHRELAVETVTIPTPLKPEKKERKPRKPRPPEGGWQRATEEEGGIPDKDMPWWNRN